MRCSMRWAFCLAASWLSLAGALAAAEPDRVGFNRDIRPIMSDTCFRCHGPDKSSRMAGMRLDLREEATKAAGLRPVPIVPGDPDNSEIIERIFDTGAKVMPPGFSHKKLTQKQKETIRLWVAQGAVYEGHWAYQPIKRPCRRPWPIPRKFAILSTLYLRTVSVAGPQSRPEADKRTLLRRVSFDLTGFRLCRKKLRLFRMTVRLTPGRRSWIA